MVNLPLDPRNGLNQASVVLQNIHEIVTINSEKELVQRMKLKSFEVLSHLLWYHESIGRKFLDEINVNCHLPGKLQDISSHILTLTCNDFQSHSDQLIFGAKWFSHP